MTMFQELSGHSDEPGSEAIRRVAASALQIGEDIRSGFTPRHYVADLADMIILYRPHGFDEVIATIRGEKPDCMLCTALAEQFVISEWKVSRCL